MHPVVLEAVEESSKWDVGTEHLLAVLGIISISLGIIIAYFKLRDQHKATITSRETAVIERNEQKELLQEMAKEFKPNHGSSLVDRVNDIGTAVSAHNAKAEQWFKDNDKAHQEIKDLHAASKAETDRRIDGLYEIMLGGSANNPRKTAQRHTNREEPS